MSHPTYSGFLYIFCAYDFHSYLYEREHTEALLYALLIFFKLLIS